MTFARILPTLSNGQEIKRGRHTSKCQFIERTRENDSTKRCAVRLTPSNWRLKLIPLLATNLASPPGRKVYNVNVVFEHYKPGDYAPTLPLTHSISIIGRLGTDNLPRVCVLD